MSILTSRALFEQYIEQSARSVLRSLEPPMDAAPHQPHSHPTLPYQPPLDETVKRRALQLLTYAFKLPERWDETRQLMLALAPRMEKAGHRHDWLPYLEKSAQLAHTLDDTVAELQIVIYMGYVYQLSGTYATAHEWFAKAVTLTHQIGDARYRARSLNCMAYVAKLQRNFDEAQSLVTQALVHIADEQDAEKAHALFILGSIELEKRNAAEAIRYFSAALEIRLVHGDPLPIARSYRGLGTGYFALGNYTEAISWSEKAITLFRQISEQVELAVAEMNVGTGWLCLEDTTKAQTYYQSAEPILRMAMDRLHLSMLYNNIGYAYYTEGKWQAAIDAYHQSIALKQEINEVAGLLNTLEGLGLVYLKIEQRQEAKEVFQQALELLSTHADAYLIDKYHGLITNHLADLGDMFWNERT